MYPTVSSVLQSVLLGAPVTEGLGAAAETEGSVKGSERVYSFLLLNANLFLKKKKKNKKEKKWFYRIEKTYLGTKGAY